MEKGHKMKCILEVLMLLLLSICRFENGVDILL